MIVYAAEIRSDWILHASDMELVRTYYSYCGSDDLETVAICDVMRGEIVRRFMLQTMKKEHTRKKCDNNV